MHAPPLLAVIARKGGVGKSTLASLLARMFALSGLRVLFVDLDPQGTATVVLVPQCAPDVTRLGEALCKGASLLPLVCESAATRLQLVPTSEGLTPYETRLSTDPFGVLKVKGAIESVRTRDYDLVVVDTPPSYGTFTFGTLAAATWVIVPSTCEEPSVQTLPSAFAAVAEARQLNPDLRILAVVANRLDRRTRHGLSALETMRRAFPEHLARTVIPASAAIVDSMSPGAVVDCRAQVNSVLVELAEELLGRMKAEVAADANARGEGGETDCGAVNDRIACTAVNE
jgi:chromosome partitioning protein